MKKMIAMILVSLMIIGLLVSCGDSDKKKTDTDSGSNTKNTEIQKTDESPTISASFALMLADDHPHVIAAKTVMAKEVSEKTDGKFTIDVQNNGALGSDAETVEATIMGTMYMTGPAAATLATIDPNWYILDVPYVFTSAEQIRNALDGELGKFLSDSLEKKAGLICLGFGESGMRALSNNKKEVASLTDIAGMKIRTLENKYHLATFSALGANPTPMAFSEVYTSLQTGQIDGQDNAVSITYTNKFYEVQKYFTKLDHLFNGNCYIVNANWFNSLPEAYQTILREAVKNAVVEQRRLVDANEEVQLEKMKEAGCVVTTLTDEKKKEFVDATQSVRDDFVKEYGETGQQMMDLAKKYIK